MRAVAVELARPATAFLRPGGNGGRSRVRWFSPAGIELTLCGHGTVAAAHVLAARGAAPRGRLVFEAPRHRLAITLEGAAPSPPRGSSRTARAGSRRAGISSPFLGDRSGCPRAPSRGWAPPARTSEEDLLIPVASLQALGALAPDLGRLGQLARDRAVRGVVLDGARDPRAGRPHSQPRLHPAPRDPGGLRDRLLACGHRRVALGDRRPRRRRRRGAVPGRAGRLPGPARPDLPSRSTAPPAARPVSASAARRSS